MPNELRPAVVFAASFLAVLLVLATVSVYVFGQYERAWGRGGSWQVLSWISLASAVLSFFGALFALIITRRRGRNLSLPRAVLGGIFSSVGIVLLLYASPPVAQSVGLWGVAVASLVLPMVACGMLSKPANPALQGTRDEAARP
jgi:hypothetical protein